MPLDLMTASRPWTTELKKPAPESRERGRSRGDDGDAPGGWFAQYLAAQSAQQREDTRLQIQQMGQQQATMLQLMNANSANMMQLVTAIMARPPYISVKDILPAFVQKRDPVGELRAMMEITTRANGAPTRDPIQEFERTATIVQKLQGDGGGGSISDETQLFTGMTSMLGAMKGLVGDPPKSSPPAPAPAPAPTPPRRPLYAGKHYDPEMGAWVEPAPPPAPPRAAPAAPAPAPHAPAPVASTAASRAPAAAPAQAPAPAPAVDADEILRRCEQDPDYAERLLATFQRQRGANGAPTAASTPEPAHQAAAPAPAAPEAAPPSTVPPPAPVAAVPSPAPAPTIPGEPPPAPASVGCCEATPPPAPPPVVHEAVPAPALDAAREPPPAPASTSRTVRISKVLDALDDEQTRADILQQMPGVGPLLDNKDMLLRELANLPPQMFVDLERFLGTDIEVAA